MKLLFLDIDGVMTSNTLGEEVRKEEKIYTFSNTCVQALNEVLQSNKVRIVLTSSWRTVFDVEQQCQIFKENGVAQLPMGQTMDIQFEDRGVEIKAYLQNHKVEGFVILDDMDIKSFAEHFVRIDPSTGLTAHHIPMVNHILSKKYSS